MGELENIGWNWYTIGLIGTTAFALAKTEKLILQWREVWRSGSSEGISAPWFIADTAIYAVQLFYAIPIGRVALIISALTVGVGQTVLLHAISRHEGFSIRERLLIFIMVLVIVITPFTDRSQDIFTLLALVGVAGALHQPWKIWKNKRAGVLKIELVKTYLAANLFWLIYAFATRDAALCLIAPLFTASYLLTVLMWYRYRGKDRATK